MVSILSTLHIGDVQLNNDSYIDTICQQYSIAGDVYINMENFSVRSTEALSYSKPSMVLWELVVLDLGYIG